MAATTLSPMSVSSSIATEMMNRTTSRESKNSVKMAIMDLYVFYLKRKTAFWQLQKQWLVVSSRYCSSQI